MLKGFRDFILRGNVIELAVAVVIGTAFNDLVKQFSASFIDPLIKLASGGKPVSGKWRLTDSAVMDWGAFVNAVLAFLATAAVVYFIFVYPMNKLAERRRRGEEPESTSPSDEVRLLTEIRDALVAGQGGRPGQSGPSGPSAPIRPGDPRY